MKKSLFYSIGIVAIVLTAAALGWWLYCHSLYKAYQSESTVTHHVAGDSLNTNSMASFSEQEIAIYGKWLEDNDNLDYKVFTLDDAQDGYYWGKEWCEADGVFEDDLEEHGNGWFKWTVKKKKLLLIHTSNIGFVVPVEYTLKQSADTMMSIQSFFHRSSQTYRRVYD